MSSNKGAGVSSKVPSYSSTNTRPPRTLIKSKIVIPRKVIASKNLSSNSSYDGKSCSTGIIATKKQERLRKVTQSDLLFKKIPKVYDYCKNCGDSCNGERNNDKIVEDSDIETMVSLSKKPSKTVKSIVGKLPKSVQQYYKNENFKPSTESLGETANGIKKISLDTINEVSEARSDSIFHIFDSDDDFDSQDSIEDLKEFRQKNYFECHSANSRIKSKVSATTLKDHKCVYRFYLNDRLFPVPLCTDHTKEVRCIECLLPMKLQVGSEGKVNGTIQAKVTLGKKNQDVMILLPIKEPLIIHEKRKESDSDKDTLFFGIINLDKMGHSVFNSTLPENSFALKYQKGFQEFQNGDDYVYNDLEKDDVIVI